MKLSSYLFGRFIAVAAAACVLLGAAGRPAAAADESIEAKYLTNVRQVTDGFVKAGEGYFSPDAH